MKILELDTVDSTMNFCWNEANDLGEQLLVIARNQTKGRGRAGRTWDSVDAKLSNNLFCSVRFRVHPGKGLTWLPLLAAVVALDSLFECSEILPEGLRLKWPNDLLVGNSKCGGILCESRGSMNDKPLDVVVGLGLNLNNPPVSVSDRPTAALFELRAKSESEFNHLRIDIAKRWATHLTQQAELLTSATFRMNLRDRWLAHARLNHYPSVEFYGENRIYSGFLIETLGENGELILVDPNTKQRVSLNQSD